MQRNSGMQLQGTHNEFQTYRKFLTEAEALQFVNFLQEEQIPYKLVKVEHLLDSAIIGNPLEFPFWVDVPVTEFARVNYLLNELTNQKLSKEVLLTDPLNALDTHELLGIVQSPENWSVESVVVAKQILLNREVDPDDHGAAITKRKDDRPHKKEISWREIVLQSMLILTLTNLHLVIGSLFALGSILYIKQSKETLMNGKRIALFSERSKQLANWLIIFYILALVSSILKLPSKIFALMHSVAS